MSSLFNAATSSAGGEGGSFTLLPKGMYLLKVVSLQPHENATNSFGPQIKWVLKVATMDGKPATDENGEPVLLWDYTPVNINRHPANRTRPFLEGFLGREIEDGEGRDDSLQREVVGKVAQAMVIQQAAKSNPAKLYNKVVAETITAVNGPPPQVTGGTSSGQAGGTGPGHAAETMPITYPQVASKVREQDDQSEIPF